VPWLLRGEEVLASAETATSVVARTRGLLGRDGLEGVLVLHPALSVHTLGMRFAVDVAYCDAHLVVVEVARMEPWRVGAPRRGCRTIIEAQAGAFERWALRPGDLLDIA
jgi:uncharacterized protein